MKKSIGNHPKLLTHVLQALADLRDIHGSTSRKIVDRIQTSINVANIKPKPRNVTMQVRKALRHGIQTGLLKQRGGKYVLSLSPVIKSSGNDKDEMKPRMCRRRRKGKKKRRRSRRRRRGRQYSTAVDSTTTVSSPSSYTSSTGVSDTEAYSVSRSRASEPEDKSRGRRKRRRRRSRRRRKSRAKSQGPDTDKKEQEKPDNTNNRIRKTRRFLPDTTKSYIKNFVDHRAMDMSPNCNNPDCLCNVKQEQENDNDRNAFDEDDPQQHNPEGYTK